MEKLNTDTMVGRGLRPRRVRLGDVISFRSKADAKGLGCDVASFAPMEDLPLRSRHFRPSQSKPITQSMASYSFFKENDVLLAKVTPCFENGKVGIAEDLKNGVGFGSSELMVLVPKAEILSPFLYHFVQSPAFLERGKQRMTGTGGLKRLPKDFILGYEIPLPPLPAQREIAAELDRICAMKKNAEERVEICQQLVKSKFVEMFGDVEANEFEWPILTFADVCKVRQGLQIPISKRLKVPESDCYEYITVAFLHGSKEREYIKSPKSTVICGKDDVLMSRTGNTGMVVTGVAGVFHNNFFLIDFDRARIEKLFLVSYLNLPIIQLEIRRRAGTSTIPDLNHGAFYSMRVPLPPLSLQREFAAYVAKVEKMEAVAREMVTTADMLYRAKLQEYFG